MTTQLSVWDTMMQAEQLRFSKQLSGILDLIFLVGLFRIYPNE